MPIAWALFPIASCLEQNRTMGFSTFSKFKMCNIHPRDYRPASHRANERWVSVPFNNKITYGDHSDWITFIECSNKHHMCRISQFSRKVIYVLRVPSISCSCICDWHLSIIEWEMAICALSSRIGCDARTTNSFASWLTMALPSNC